MTSSISSISPKNITSFCEQVFGQNFNKPRTTGSVNTASFSRNCTTQYANCAWYSERHLTLCSGNNTLTRNCLCSAFSGKAKPLIILREKGNNQSYVHWAIKSIIMDGVTTSNVWNRLLSFVIVVVVVTCLPVYCETQKFTFPKFPKVRPRH